MPRLLVAWIGRTDLRAPVEEAAVGAGPIAQALAVREFDEAWLLSDFDPPLVAPYIKWLRSRTAARLEVLPSRLRGPTHFGDIHDAAVRGVQHALGSDAGGARLTFHLSPGTPAMAAVWILLSKTRFPAELIESSRDHGVHTVSVPFDISADYLPDLLRDQDAKLRAGSAALAPPAPEFADIIHRSAVMARLIQRAERVAVRSVPVLVEGESGTGKELLARAIHRASPRRDGPFVAVNCGAIPPDLVESELFGHRKGAFTGADRDQAGTFEEADGGTLFLDEVGELPLAAQVKLLRAVQEGEIVRVGASKPVNVNVRIVAATNRTLTEEIAAGRFREDLFYRLAVAVLKIPALRERPGDLGLLIDRLLDQVNTEARSDLGAKQKKLSAGARTVLLAHAWPGNVRELFNTLRRAALWSDGETIAADDARDAVLPVSGRATRDVIGRPLGPALRLPEVLAEVARHYLSRALQESHGNKSKAAALVGLPSYQTLTNWMGRYQVKHGPTSD